MQAINVATHCRTPSGVHLVYGTEPQLRPRYEPIARALARMNIGATVPVGPGAEHDGVVEIVVSTGEAERIRKLAVTPFVYCFELDGVGLVIPVEVDGSYFVRAWLGDGRFWQAHDFALEYADRTDRIVAFRAAVPSYRRSTGWA